MVLVLEDEHLESLQCSRCHKYLSVFPIKNHPNREVTCGRCSGIDADQDDSTRSTLYELVAEKYLFKCVNRYEGCRKLLRADETQAHESQCDGSDFHCPKCKDGNVMSVLELIWHYKQRHPSSYLKKNVFNGKPPNSDDVLLYVQEDVVFFIFMEYTPSVNVLHLSAVTLIEMKATQAFSITSGSHLTRTEKRPCTTASKEDYFNIGLDPVETVEVIFNLEVLKNCKLYDISTPSTSKSTTGESVECVDQIESKEGSTVDISKGKAFKVQLAVELNRKLGYRLIDHGTALLDKTGNRIDLTCSNCKQLIRLPTFRCSKLKHMICRNCRAWCGICDSSVIQSNSDDLLRKISEYLSFPCRWKCGEYFNSDLRTHENSCKLKILKCPICSFEMDLSDSEFMDIHLLDKHQMLNFIREYNVERVKQFINQKLNGELSFLFHDKCCYLKWSQNGHNNVCYLYDLNFGLFGNEPNLKLDIICDGSKRSCNNVLPKVRLSSISSYEPYINFNCA